ncbi:hypothetical protein CJ030_MR2G019961 [Morella rubra]|uniref:Uncharacterized protein n=1 Tax=Morella rubra TaxID=262757 RepID=A0A6A1W8Z1_9ROSI|nr:hypothetical protein CJ030_MR2G019961 [Morella rubra]
MSRHRRQASLVLPPDLISGDEPVRPADMGQATVGVVLGHGATGTCPTVRTGRNTDSQTANQEGSVSHCPATAKKPPIGKPACKAEDQC